jgi:hypothetical protein
MATKKFEAFLAKVGARPDCEVCGHNDWSFPQDDDQVTTVVPTAQTVGGRLYQMQGQALRAYMVVCLNCGNVRFHAQQVVAKGGFK